MKHMKKSMFITTVFMVVLLIVAVSTATFAWYTTSNTVSTVATQVNSATSEGANISIGWSDTTPVGQNSLEFYTNASPYNPMVPINNQGSPDLTFANITNSTIFATSSLSFGSLSGIASATPYIGKVSSEGAGIFYVLNYALKPTNIKFEATVTGDNAARLRVAVFETTTGKLVYVNKDFSWGTQMNQVPLHYDVLTEQPADWGVKFASYYTDGAGTTPVVGVAPAWKNNTFYKSGTVVNTAGDGIPPALWAEEFNTYTTADLTPVAAAAPAFSSGNIYKKIPLALESLKCEGSQKITASSIDTLIGQSTGTEGIARGFVVKAWFDGPTQVDAYGGQAATFALTVTATNAG